MEYTKEIRADKKVKFTIKITNQEWQAELQNAYQQTKSKYKVEGFRQGKAPRKIIEKEYGDTVFYDDALNNVFYKYYGEVLNKEKIDTVGTPSLNVEKIDENGVELTITTDVYPTVTLGAYTGITIEKPQIKVTESEVNGALKNMQEKAGRMVAVDRPAKNGDTLIIDFVGKKDGVEFNGGTAKGYELQLGSGAFIPGFEDQLVGATKGEQKVVNVTFPKDYPSEELADKPCTFDVTVNEIREKVLPELNDEFAKNVSEFDTLADYKKDIKAQITKQKQQKADQEAEEKLLEQIAQNAIVDIPEVMIEEQAEEFIHQFAHRLEHQGLNLQDYLKYMNTTEQELKKSRMEDAKKTVKTRLVLAEILKKENISVSKEDIDAEVAKQAQLSGVEVEEFKKTLHDHDIDYLANDIVLSKLFDFLKKNNNI